MTTYVRELLQRGNSKLGESIHVWNVPAVETCPGSTSKCRSVCYATKYRFRFKQIRERLSWNWEQAQLPDFVDRMVAEIRKKGCFVIRIHSAGDFATAEYAEKWLQIMKRCPKPRFYFYSRSWRIAEIAPVLEAMAALKCCRVWYSVDSETGLPDYIPPGVRLAYLQVERNEVPELAHMTFRVRRLRKESKLGLPMVCSSETPEGKATDTNCGNCGICFQ